MAKITPNSNSAVEFRAKFVVDGTGPRGFLHRALGLSELDLPGYPRTQALYSHFSAVRRLEETPYSRVEEAPPFPVDDAAVQLLAHNVEEMLLHLGPEVSTQEVGVAVLEQLRMLDDVAYLRFASVYKGFEAADDFAREAGLLTKETAPKLHEHA